MNYIARSRDLNGHLTMLLLYGTIVFFVAEALLVIPAFLDYAEEAKTYGLSLSTLLLLGACLVHPRLRADLAERLTALMPQFTYAGLLFGSSIATSMMLSTAPSAIAIYGLRNLILPIVAAMLISCFVTPRSLCAALAVSSTIIAMLGLTQVVLHLTYLTPASDPGQFPAVTFGNRGFASLYVALGGVPTLALLRWHRDRLLPWCAAALTLQGLFIVAAVTRTSLLASAVSIAVYWCMAGRPLTSDKFKLRTVTAWVLTAGLIAAVTLSFVWRNERIRLLVDQRLDPSTWLNNPRLALWRLSLTHWLDSPWQRVAFGFGPGSFSVHSQDWTAGSAIGSLVFQQAHNDLVQGLLEYGLIGASLWLFFALSPWLAARQPAARETTAAEQAPRGLFVSLNTLFAASTMFTFVFQMPFFSFIFWLLIFVSAQPVAGLCSPANLTQRFAIAGFSLIVAGLLLVETIGRPSLEIPMHTLVNTPAGDPSRSEQAQHLRQITTYVPTSELYFRLIGPTP